MKHAAITAIAVACLVAAGPAPAGNDMEEAMAFYESGHYVHARDRLRAAARSGDARAAEILGFMYSYGSGLFPGMGRDMKAAEYWFDIAARGGRPVGRYMVCALRKQSGGPGKLSGRYCFDWVAERGHPVPQ